MMAAAVAAPKGRTGCAWFTLGVLFGPFALLVAVLPSAEHVDRREAQQVGGAGEFRKCPFCAEVIRVEAKLCRFCRSELETTDEGDSCPITGD